MKTFSLVIVSLLLIALSLGCQSTNTRAVEGGVIGGIVGAVGGTIIGHQSDHDAEGALVGAATGAVAGALIGSQMEKPGQTTQPVQATQPASANQMSIQQIVDLTKQGVHEAVIIDRIRMTNSRFTLNASDIDYLKKQGVSQKVIDAMQGF